MLKRIILSQNKTKSRIRIRKKKNVYLQCLIKVSTSRLKISTCWSPKVASVALDVIQDQEDGKYSYFVIPTLADFSIFHWNVESVTLASTYHIWSYTLHPIGNQTEQHIQPTGNKECRWQ
jgi:hypothetical protein